MTQDTKQLILIVDDKPENIDLMANILRSDYEIKAAVSGEKALKISLEDPKPAMILLDIMMPGMDGYEVCRQLKANTSTCDIPIIFVTARAETREEEYGFELGAVDYIRKPVSPPTVIARVRTHLQLYDHSRALEEMVHSRTVELQSSQLRLMKSEQFLNAIIENIPDMIYVKRADNLEFVRLNKAGEDLIGISREEVVGKFAADLFPSEMAKMSLKTDQEALSSWRMVDIPNEQLDTRHQGKRRAHTKKIPIMDENGVPEYLLGISEDITMQKQIEEQLRQTQQMESIGNLAGGIAHDFNNILFPIIGLSELLLEDLDPGSMAYENAQEVLIAGKRGSDLVKQILAFSRQSDQKLIPVRIQKILKEVLKLIRSTIPSDIDINHTIQHDCALVMADPVQVHQVAMNLITNAYHAVQDQENNRQISLDLKEIEISKKDIPNGSLLPGPYILMTISDTGYGIDPEVREKIFEPCFTTKEHGKGTGLGLAVVFGIIKKLKGEIKVTSELNVGTTFEIYLPTIEKAAESIPIRNINTNMVSGTEHILLVDDEEPIAKLESQMLQRLGYKVTSVISSREGLDIFTTDPSAFDLVITDMTMPNLTGDQLAKEMIAIRADIPVIICTGFSERINKKSAEEMGIKGFLMKPVVRSEMAKIVRNVLDEAKPS